MISAEVCGCSVWKIPFYLTERFYCDSLFDVSNWDRQNLTECLQILLLSYTVSRSTPLSTQTSSGSSELDAASFTRLGPLNRTLQCVIGSGPDLFLNIIILFLIEAAPVKARHAVVSPRWGEGGGVCIYYFYITLYVSLSQTLSKT